ncbi:polyamine aminopropyltransferase [Candidatus Berkiella aquae]|uniref:Polyamine aminopropyltransferase n=1 Tax=Candidatus Berkiella aquae TaxID=295108 RepID=A0A0Q9YQ43_9GAMM|nr:polyamine aminopropyltransferase [Candidatus Berkiella aquae]MCS5709949.1 polyamine aminopropyltransferase [Candidatus Berkiella aquae]
MALLLLFSVFVVSTCGLIYELICGTLASYLLGDSITQFSTIIGVYLFSMGVGSYLSKFIDKNLIEFFIKIELLIGLLGGFSALLLFVAFEFINHFRPLLYSIVFLIGCCVGLEIPLMMRILKEHYTDFKDLVSKVFTFDYIGALLASLLFPLLLVPHLGLVRSALLFGLINTSVGMLAIWSFRNTLNQHRLWYIKAMGCSVVLAIAFIFSNTLTTFAEAQNYEGKILYSKSTPYQRIVLTRNQNDIRLFLNGNLQFSSRDEYRYHEALVHLGLSQIASPKKVLVLGGGDGFAVREILKYPSVEEITLVDLDPAMTELFRCVPLLYDLNEKALQSNKVKIIHDDAFLWLRKNQQFFDFIVVDFPDPSNFSLGKLYSNAFYRTLYAALNQNGMAVIQSTSPLVARKSYWCIANTLSSVGFFVKPYVTYVPAFGLWGYHLVAKSEQFSPTYRLPHSLKYLTQNLIPSLFNIPHDMDYLSTEINALNNQALVRYFEDEWLNYVG